MVEEPAAVHAWTIVDGDAPDTTIELGPPATTSSRTATFTFSSNESDARFECALDAPSVAAASWNDCAEPPENTAEFADLTLGDHELLVRAVDPSDNADATPASHGWTGRAGRRAQHSGGHERDRVGRLPGRVHHRDRDLRLRDRRGLHDRRVAPGRRRRCRSATSPRARASTTSAPPRPGPAT